MCLRFAKLQPKLEQTGHLSQHTPRGALARQLCPNPVSHSLGNQLCPRVKHRGFSHHIRSLPRTLHSWCKHPWNPRATRQRTWKLQEESKGRQELFARFPGYWCALLAALQVCSILRVLSRGSWLLTQMLCEFLGLGAGRERQSPWKNACKNSVHVAIYNNSRRLSLTHGSKYPQDLQRSPRTKETNGKHRDAGSE